MDEQKPKVEPWNYNKLDASKSPEVTNKEHLGMSDAGKSLGGGREYSMPRFYVLLPMAVIILLIAIFIDQKLAWGLEAVCFVPMLFFYDRANEKSGKGSALFFWLLLAGVLAVIIYLTPTRI